MNLKIPIKEDFIDQKKFQFLIEKKEIIKNEELKSNKKVQLFDLQKNIEIQLTELNIKEKEFEKTKNELISNIEKNKALKSSLELLNEKRKWIIKKTNDLEGEEITCPECAHTFSPHHTNFKQEILNLVKEKNSISKDISGVEDEANVCQKFINKYKDIVVLDKLLKQQENLSKEVEREMELFLLSKDKQISQISYELDFFNENNQKLFEAAFQRNLIDKQNIQIDIDSLIKNINELEIKIQSLTNKESFLNEKNALLKEFLKKQRQERDYLNELITCLGKENFIRLVTEETLSLITQKVNKFLSEIPNTEKITVKLSIDKETKKGTIKKNINLQVFSSGLERPYEEFSGGEKCSINLATDTAIAEIIAERTGKRFNWFIIDEAQNGMDSITKMESLQVLNKLAKDKLILVIDHSNGINEYLDGQIIVLKTSEGSTIVTSNKNIALN